jgi:hypothetical protein
MNFQERFPPDDDIWMYSDPRRAQSKAFEVYGPNAILFRSKTKSKKYFIKSPEGKTVNFGQMGYEDFLKHRNPTRRLNYLNRSFNIKGDWKKNGYSPNNLSRNILW